ncbi:hypothetical protein ACFUJR_04335 [Streptomyces sp. NPDC057271]
MTTPRPSVRTGAATLTGPLFLVREGVLALAALTFLAMRKW